jgi:hypothetical protein
MVRLHHGSSTQSRATAPTLGVRRPHPPSANVGFVRMPALSKAILVSSCAAVALSVTVGAADPAMLVLGSSSLAGVIVVRRRPASAEQWFSVQLVMAMTVAVLGWGVSSQLDGVLTGVLLGGAGACQKAVMCRW